MTGTLVSYYYFDPAIENRQIFMRKDHRQKGMSQSHRGRRLRKLRGRAMHESRD